LNQIRHKKFGLMVTRDCSLGSTGCVISRHTSKKKAQQRYDSWISGGWCGYVQVMDMNQESEELEQLEGGTNED
jgi:hypothetical protein